MKGEKVIIDRDRLEQHRNIWRNNEKIMIEKLKLFGKLGVKQIR